MFCGHKPKDYGDVLHCPVCERLEIERLSSEVSRLKEALSVFRAPLKDILTVIDDCVGSVSEGLATEGTLDPGVTSAGTS